MKLLTILTISLLIVGCSAGKVHKTEKHSGDQDKSEAMALQKVHPETQDSESSIAYDLKQSKSKKTKIKRAKSKKKFNIPWLSKKHIPSPVKAAKGHLRSKIDKTGAILLIIALLVGVILILTLLESGSAAFIGTTLVALAILLFAVLILILLGYIGNGGPIWGPNGTSFMDS